MAVIIDGKEVSARTRESIASETEEFKKKTGVTPGLAVIIVGNDPASAVYVRNKHKACEAAGMHSVVIEMPEDAEEQTLLDKVKKLAEDEKIHGILVQLPLPNQIDEQKVINAIPPSKDVDAFHPANVGRIMLGNQSFVPCTPAGVMELIKAYDIETEGKHCVIIGRSNIVGKPQAMLMLQKNATVTICHSRTKNLKEITTEADIIVAAVGKQGFVTADMVREGAAVIDVGINRGPDGKLHGDVDFESVSKKASYITPVPGGVGPMTITMLLRNTLTAAKEAYRKKC